MIKNFLQELRTQRWDDHRYYHHSRINQSLHFVSAASFLFAYAMLFIDPVVSALVGWLVSMTSRQAGHFFFEPRGYDHVNQATHEHKEEIKVGYNLQRKVVLMAIWALSPAGAVFRSDPVRPVHALGLAGRLHAPGGQDLAGGRHRRVAVPHRPSVLHPRRRDRPGLDDEDPHRPFSDLKLYYKAPLFLMKGELIDPGLESTSSTRERCVG